MRGWKTAKENNIFLNVVSERCACSLPGGDDRISTAVRGVKVRIFQKQQIDAINTAVVDCFFFSLSDE